MHINPECKTLIPDPGNRFQLGNEEKYFTVVDVYPKPEGGHDLLLPEPLLPEEGKIISFTPFAVNWSYGWHRGWKIPDSEGKSDMFFVANTPQNKDKYSALSTIFLADGTMGKIKSCTPDRTGEAPFLHVTLQEPIDISIIQYDNTIRVPNANEWLLKLKPLLSSELLNFHIKPRNFSYNPCYVVAIDNRDDYSIIHLHDSFFGSNEANPIPKAGDVISLNNLSTFTVVEVNRGQGVWSLL